MIKQKIKGKFSCKCDFCGNILFKYKSQIKKYNFCNLQCKNKWGIGKSFMSEEKRLELKEKFKGENNPNFNNKWNDEQRKRASNHMIEWFADGYEGERRRQEVSKVHKGKTLSVAQRLAVSKAQKGHASTITDESRIKIGIKSKEKFTPEYKAKLRKKLEMSGQIVPLADKDDYLFYRICADWIERMFDYIKDQSKLDKLKKFGVFNSKSNIGGIVRDHMYSRRCGWENGVFPEILRHPVNLDILLHSENVGKKIKRYKDFDSISLLKLFDNIKNFDGNWFEQDKCLELIKRYEDGERYKKSDYINEYYTLIKSKAKQK